MERSKPKTKATAKSPRAPVPTPRLALANIPPPLLEGEDADAYQELHARVFADVQPAGVIEEFWIRDIVDLQWEILRLRRLKVNFMNATVHKGLADANVHKGLDDRDVNWFDTAMEQFYNADRKVPVEQLVEDFKKLCTRREPEAVKKVDDLLPSAYLSMDAAMAHTFLQHFESVERIERMIATMEKRRDTVVREIDRRQAALAQTVRRVVEQIEHNDYQVLEDRSAVRDTPQ